MLKCFLLFTNWVPTHEYFYNFVAYAFHVGTKFIFDSYSNAMGTIYTNYIYLCQCILDDSAVMDHMAHRVHMAESWVDNLFFVWN